MVDWWGILANFLWVSGLATGLAAFSMAYYKAQSAPIPLRCALQEMGFQFPFCIGMVLFGLGLLFSGQSLGERIIGGLAAVVFVAQAARLWKHWCIDRSES